MTLADVQRYEQSRVPPVGDHAVVVGGSMAGLTAARVLADAFADVTVLERDEYPDEPAPRRGVPQGAHIHALQEAGRATLEDLFPGFCDTVLARGGLLIDGATDLKFYSEGDYLADGPRRLPMYSASRPLFEHAVRTHATTVEGIDLRSGCQVTDYLTDEAGARVTGVEFRDEHGDERELPADVVVDATGRTSRTPEWLRERGYTPPELEEVRVDVEYSTTAVRRPPDDRRAILAIAEPPHTRGGAVFPVEDDLWLVNLHGVHGAHPPSDPDRFADFADGIPAPEVKAVIDNHPRVWDDVDYYPFPSNRRYYYEAVDRFPDGLVVVGDAIASFNPIYGQGMSVAALEALVLHHVLASGETGGIGRRFFDRVADIVDTAWTMAVGADVQFPQTTGPSTPATDVFARYLSVLFRRAHTDGETRDALFRVISMEKPPSSLLRPGVVGRALNPRTLVHTDTIPTPTSDESPEPS